jgi:hypothetical protein
MTATQHVMQSTSINYQIKSVAEPTKSIQFSLNLISATLIPIPTPIQQPGDY